MNDNLILTELEFRHRTSCEFLRDFLSIIRSNNNKNNTYKFALARFLLDHSKKSDNPLVRFSTIAEFFFKYYWLQECKSRLRQGPTHQVPRVITIIRTRFIEARYPHTYDEICDERSNDVDWCQSEIQKCCFRDVIHRFHNSLGDEKVFFDYFAERYANDKSGNAKIDPGGGIRINPDAMKFFNQYYEVLYRAVILEWIRFIEKLNFGLPHLVEKIEGNVAEPYNQKKFLKILKSFTDSCFYCGKKLTNAFDNNIDHVIPFDYIAGTELWNLVLACKSCSHQKLGSLPPQKYIEKLTERNMRHKNNRQLNKSLKLLNYGNGSVMWHYNNAHMQGYHTMTDFT